MKRRIQTFLTIIVQNFEGSKICTILTSLMLTKAGLFDQKDSKTVILLQFSLHYLCFKQLCSNSLNIKFSNKIYKKYFFLQ